MATKYMVKVWEEYRKAVIPPDASIIQVVECKKAFYGGASAYMSIILGAGNLDESVEPTEKDIKFLDDITNELQTFANGTNPEFH